MVLALYAAFWLEIDGASSAATCVAILALPTRGQSFEKAAYRSLATVIGLAASIAIAGLFLQARDLFLVAYAGWLGLCVFAAGMLDGNRAYGAVLSGYTVAIVAVTKIDAPRDVFLTGMNRGAAIAIGIAATALVSDLFAAPNVHTKLLDDLRATRRKVAGFAGRALRDGSAEDEAAASLLKALAALHPEISAAAAEVPGGRARAAAARSIAAALVETVMVARAAATDAPQSALASALGDAAATATALGDIEARALGAPVGEAAALRRAALVAEADLTAASGLDDLADGRRPGRTVRLPLYRCRRQAAGKAMRVGLAVALSSGLLIYSSWPSTSISVSLLGILAALGSTSPSTKGFSTAAVLAIPLSVAVAGATEFLVLDGVDAFPLLAIAMAPPVIGACLLASSQDPKMKGIGTLLLVFFPVFLSPSNPQDYSPQSFLIFGLLGTVAALLLALWLVLLPAASDARRRRWLVRSAADDLASATRRKGGWRPAEAAYRSADRIGQLAGLGADADTERSSSLADAFALAEVEDALRRAVAGAGPGTPVALAPARLRGSAEALLAAARTAARHGPPEATAFRPAWDLLLAADTIDRRRPELDRLVPGLVWA